MRVRLHSVLGNDDVADRLNIKLIKKGIDTELCQKAEGKTGRTIVLLTPGGISTKLGHAGVALQIENHLADTSTFSLFSHVHLASVTLPLVHKVLRMKHNHHNTPTSTTPTTTTRFPSVSLDLGATILAADPNELREALGQLDYVFLNEYSLKVVYGINLEDPSTSTKTTTWPSYLIEKLDAIKHNNNGARESGVTLVVTLGTNGAYAISAARGSFFQPSENVEVVDTTGISFPHGV